MATSLWPAPDRVRQLLAEAASIQAEPAIVSRAPSPEFFLPAFDRVKSDGEPAAQAARLTSRISS